MKKILEAQLNVLGCLMANPYGLQEKAMGLTPEHFPDMEKMADAILNFKLDIRDGEFKDMQLANITDDERALDLYNYADKDNWEYSRDVLLRNHRKNLTSLIAHDLLKSTGDIEDLTSTADKINRIAEGFEQKDYSVLRIATELYAQVAAGKPLGPEPIPTNLTPLNKLIGGIRPGTLIVIGARPGMGKTSLAIQIAKDLALDGNPVSIFSLEMSESQLASKMISQSSGVELNRIDNQLASEEEKKRFIHHLNMIAELPISIYDGAEFYNVDKIYGRSLVDINLDKIKCVVVDYIQLIKLAAGSGNKTTNEKVNEVSNTLMRLKKHGVAVIAISQLSRKIDERPDKEPVLSDLRDSGAIEQDADIVLFPVRYSYYEMENPIDYSESDVLFCKKNRFGVTGWTKIGWEGEYTRFTNPDPPKPILNSNMNIEPMDHDDEDDVPF